MTSRWRRRAAVVGLLALSAACTRSPASSTVPVATTTAPSTTVTTFPDVGPVAPPVRHPAVGEFIYFVMTDRFANGDPTNDSGGLDGGALETGFLPDNKAYHQGGDLVGLTQRLGYLAELGVEAIWITPPFTNRFVQGDGSIDGSSSSYHGYWQVDWSHIDPHLGSDADMQAFIQAAHAAGMSVYFDIVVNHTGDVITYEGESFVYYAQTAKPYLDVNSNPFDPAIADPFPELDPAVSFPYVPTFANQADAGAKSPEWLNDPTLYHNRGNSTFNGESSLFGDFFGLDDLFTEHPLVREGMTELYGEVIERFDVDGFRVDTVKHVDSGFWEFFAPRIRARAEEAGRDDFFMFGEVFDQDPIFQSSFTNLGFDATLDFIVAAGLERYVAGGAPGSALGEAFDNDDWFTDVDSNASMQVKFFGNHDMGRMGYQIAVANPTADEASLVDRMKLGFDLLFLTRGVPVVYYGDEQGFTGSGGDQLARQTMFGSDVPEYSDDNNLGSDLSPAVDNFDPNHPLYRWITELSALRREHQALRTGAQIVHQLDGPLFGFSRIDRSERIEYVVVANNSTLEVPARVPTVSPGTEFVSLRSDARLTSEGNGDLVVPVPPMSAVVLRAEAPVAVPAGTVEVSIVRPKGSEIPTFRYRLEAELSDSRFAEVTFAVMVDGAEPVVVGTDDAAPYRVYWDNSDVPDGAEVEVIATVDDGSGHLASDSRTVTLGVRR